MRIGEKLKEEREKNELSQKDNSAWRMRYEK